jgi:hypothetical protein
MVVLEPSVPEPIRRAFMRLDQEYAPLSPVAPVGVPSYSTDDLPPASMYPGTIAYNSTLGSLVYSDGSAWS